MSVTSHSSVHTARELTRVAHPSIPDTFGLDGRLLIGTSEAEGDDGSIVRIGFLSDMPHGSALAEYLDPIILAIEDAIEENGLRRPVELIATHVVGLPVGREENVAAAFHDLAAKGCALVLSAGVTNNALVLRDHINTALVPYITMAGTTRFTGPYCFSLANGGHGEEAAILAAYLAAQGHRRVVLTGESSPGDVEYRQFFEEQAALYGIEILDAHYFDNDADEASLDAVLARFRDLDPDALAYCGFGFNSRQLNPALDRIGWAPPRVMNAAIMWALSSPEWAAALDGWIGIEQTNNDHDDVEKNRNWVAMLDRFEARFGRRTDGTMTALLYDQGRAVVQAIANAPTLDGPGLAVGLERIKMMPTTIGGPRTYIGFGPEDHRGYRGDFMFMKELRDGKFHFASYHWPEWPINQRS